MYSPLIILDDEWTCKIMEKKNIPPDDYDKIWITKDEEVVYIKDMTDGHLIIVCLLLKKEAQLVTNVHALQNSMFGPSPGTMAEEHFEIVIEEAENRHPMVVEKLNQILAEMNKRKLKAPNIDEYFPWRKLKAHILDEVEFDEGEEIKPYKYQIPVQVRHGIPVGESNKKYYGKKQNGNSTKQQLY